MPQVVSPSPILAGNTHTHTQKTSGNVHVKRNGPVVAANVSDFSSSSAFIYLDKTTALGSFTASLARFHLQKERRKRKKKEKEKRKRGQ